jgi:stringent starvation protein B
MQSMSSNRPYLLKAFYDWILDNECTPYIVVEADMPHVEVPPQTVKNGQVVLNISPGAVHGMNMGMNEVSFSARFGGVPFQIYIPMYAISAIYARENGAGTMFPPEELDEDSISDLDSDTTDEVPSAEPENKVESTKSSKGSHLSLVKK